MRKHVESILVLPENHAIQIRATVSSSSYIKQKIIYYQKICGRKKREILEKRTGAQFRAGPECETEINRYTVVVFFKSKKVVKKIEGGSTCTKMCVGESKCRYLPFSTLQQCLCPANYDGELCDERSNTSFANDLNLMLKESITIPQLSDVFFKVQDIQEDIAEGFGSINNALNSLTKTFKSAFQEFSGNMKKLFKETQLLVKYGPELDNLRDAIIKSNDLFSPSDEDIKNGMYDEEQMLFLAKDLIIKLKVSKWVRMLDKMFKGQQNGLITKIPALLLSTMNKRESSACSNAYKRNIDTIAKRFYLLQSETFLMYIQARNVLKKETSWVVDKYKKQVESQVIRHTVNLFSY